MKKTIIKFLLLLFILSCNNNEDQNETEEQFCGIYVGNILLRTMTEIEEFAQCNYSEITGNLGIFDGIIQSPITSLSSLSSLKKIGGDLSLNSLSVLTTLNGLHNIESVNYLSINYTNQLENLDKIDLLQTKFIEMSNNISLKNINALDMDSDEMGLIAIYNHPVLENLQCFSNIKFIRNNLTISNNNSLIDLSGLDSLERVGTYSGPNNTGPNDPTRALVIEDNRNLLSVNGLNNLREIKGDIWIYNNFFLENIDGLSNLLSIYRNLYINENTYLNNLDGLQNLSYLNGDIQIASNPLLRRFCGLHTLFSTNGHNGSYGVGGNYFNPSAYQIQLAPPCN
jgi:hypothetical protein